MALPVRLTSVLGRHPGDLTEDDLQRAKTNRIPEGEDLDWKRELYEGKDAGKHELAKDVSAMANTRGGLIVVGVDDGGQDHAHGLAPLEADRGPGEEWMRQVLANWIHPVVPYVGIRRVPSAQSPGRCYWIITVEPSPQAPHMVAVPSGNDFRFRVYARHGTTTRTLTESEIAQRYRDRARAARDDIDRLSVVDEEGLKHLGKHVGSTAPDGPERRWWQSVWLSLAGVPTVRGNCPLFTWQARDEALRRFQQVTQEGEMFRVRPRGSAVVARRQVRFEGSPAGQLHEDGSFYAAVELELQQSRKAPHHDPKLLDSRVVELTLTQLVQAAAAWATEAGAGGDLMLCTRLYRFGGTDAPLRLVDSDSLSEEGPVSTVPDNSAQTTAHLAAVAAERAEAVSAAYTLAADLLADMGVDEPRVLTPHGELKTEPLRGM
ncbi:ATP-binding protein [Streptomyces hirsutus]|uniref:AlbA family DNA-binding domain-containing protein n=1 Tax=Streptomyces hirsutus TaxID=35620 RepID=UPI0033C7B21A